MSNSAILFENQSVNLKHLNQAWRHSNVPNRNSSNQNSQREATIHSLQGRSIRLIQERKDTGQDKEWKSLTDLFQPQQFFEGGRGRSFLFNRGCIDFLIKQDTSNQQYELCARVDKEFYETLNAILGPFTIQIEGSISQLSYGYQDFPKYTFDVLVEKICSPDFVISLLTSTYDDGFGSVVHSNGYNCSVQFTVKKISINWNGKPTGLKLSSDKILSLIYKNDETKDVKIIVGNRAEVKCHAMVLAAHSSVFSTMITTKMKESKTGRIEIPDMSQVAMEHLIRYFYGMEIPINKLISEVALQLFQASHKYNLRELEEPLGKLFLEKEASWFTGDTILELYYFVKNLDGKYCNLEQHLLSNMTKMGSKLQSCQRFLELGKKDSLELVWKLVEVAKST